MSNEVALLERISQFDAAIRRIAHHVGAVCGGVDTGPGGGHTAEEIIRRIDVKIEAARQPPRLPADKAAIIKRLQDHLPLPEWPLLDELAERLLRAPNKHDWQPDGGVLKFESHPGTDVPHVHATCTKCKGRAWFTELQWEMLSKGCAV